jgi:hypothetical protein
MSDIVTPAHNQRKRNDLVLWQADVRRAVRSIGLHKSEADVCIAILNHYWAINKDKMSARGMGHKVCPIYPGLQKIADKADVSLRSCKRASSILQKLNILKVVGFKNGGRGSAQRFTINFQEIYACNGLEKSEIAALRPARKGCHKGGHKGDTVAHGLNSLNMEEIYNQENIIRFSDYRKPPTERPL